MGDKYMNALFVRLCEIRNEHFNEISNDRLVVFKNLLTPREENEEYSSGELIVMLSRFSDLFNMRGV